MAHKAKKLKDDDDDDDDEKSRFVNKALPVRVVAVGDDYEKIRMAITAFRFLFHRMDGIIASAQAATTTFVPRVVKRKPKKPKNKKEAREEAEKLAKIDAANEAAKEFLGVDIDPARIRRLVVDWMGGSMGKGAYYELRNVFFGTLLDEVHKGTSGRVSFNSAMFDELRQRLAAERYKIVTRKNGGKVPRNILEATGQCDLISVNNMAMSLLRCTRRQYAELYVNEADQSIRMRLQWGPTEANTAEVMLDGETTDSNGKKWSKSLKNDKYALKLIRRMLEGRIQYCTPTINMHKKGGLTLNIPYKMEKRVFAALKASSVAELDFFAVDGRELPHGKDYNGADDGKLFVMHLCQGARRFSIAVNDVLGELTRCKMERNKLELERDVRRYWPRKFTRPLQERVSNLTTKRTRYEKNANHAWTKRIIDMAGSWLCGTLKVHGPPDGAAYGLTGSAEHPWSWYQFKQFLAYKAKFRGIKLVFVKHADMSQLRKDVLDKLDVAVEAEQVAV